MEMKKGNNNSYSQKSFLNLSVMTTKDREILLLKISSLTSTTSAPQFVFRQVLWLKNKKKRNANFVSSGDLEKLLENFVD